MRPHQGLGQGEGGDAEGGGAGEFHLERISFISLVHARCHARCKHSSPAIASKEGGGASCWDSSPLLDDLSLFFPFPQCHFQNSLQITRNYIYNFTGYPGIAGAVVPVIFRGTRTSFGLPLRGSPNIYYLFRAPDGLYFPGPEPYIYGVYTIFLAGKSPKTQCIYTVLANLTYPLSPLRLESVSKRLAKRRKRPVTKVCWLFF